MSCASVFGGIGRGCLLLMDVFLFLFVVSQECSFSHAVSRTHTHTHAVVSLCMLWEKSRRRKKREEGDERAAGVNLIPPPRTKRYAKDTLRRAGESFKSNSLFPPVLT